MAAWDHRAQADLALHQAAGDSVVLVVGTGTEPELTTLRAGLAAAGYEARDVQLAGLPAWLLVEAGAPPRATTDRSSRTPPGDAAAPAGDCGPPSAD
jgi:hypothetical protein